MNAASKQLCTCAETAGTCTCNASDKGCDCSPCTSQAPCTCAVDCNCDQCQCESVAD